MKQLQITKGHFYSYLKVINLGTKEKVLFRIFIILAITLAFSSCRKYKKDSTVAEFHLFNRVTNQGFEGVTVKIYEQREKLMQVNLLSTEYETKLIWEGKTDANGKAKYSFQAFKDSRYTYWHSVGQSFMNGRELISQPEYGPIKKNDFTDLSYTVVDKNIPTIKWFKNNNCFDENDKCRYRYHSIKNGSWSPWYPSTQNPNFPTGYYVGCYEYLSANPVYTDQNIIFLEYEIIRNGVQSTLFDTIYIIGNNGIDTLNYFY